MTTEFSYLGYITLSDNASTMYKSRELKSVALPETEAVSLKLRLHKPHSNAHNVYQQVYNPSVYIHDSGYIFCLDISYKRSTKDERSRSFHYFSLSLRILKDLQLHFCYISLEKRNLSFELKEDVSFK